MVNNKKKKVKYCIHLVGFPHSPPPSDNRNDIVSVANAIKALVPEADVYDHDIFDADEGDGPQNHDWADEHEVMPSPGANGYSIQVIGPPGCGKSVTIKFISQEKCHESPVILLEHIRNTHNTSHNIYDIYTSLIHQLLSQQPGVFRSLRVLLSQTLSRDNWSLTSSLVLLTEMLLRCQSLEFLIVIYDFEEWPLDIQSWWSNSLVPLLRSCGINFNILSSSRKIIESFDSLTLCSIDVEREYDSFKHGFVNQIVSYLIDRAYGQRNKGNFVKRLLKKRIISNALSFQGSFISIRAHVASLLPSFPLNNEEAIQNALVLSPATETEFYEAESLALPQRFPSTLFWITAVISWLLGAARPLRVSELATAAAVNMDDQDLNDVKYKISMDMDYDLKRHVSAFIVIENGYVRIASEAAREVLSRVDVRKRLCLEGDYGLTLLCLHYLEIAINGMGTEKWIEYRTQPFRRDSMPWLNDSEYRFFDYACRFWPTHFLRVEDPDQKLIEAASHFLLNPELGKRWFEFYFILNGRAAGSMENVHEVSRSVDALTSPGNCKSLDCVTESSNAACSRVEAAAMASYIGLQPVITFIMKSPLPEVETSLTTVRRGWFQGPVAFLKTDSPYFLEAAIATDMADLVDEMFRKNPTGVTDLFPLHTAALMGSHKTVNLLLKILKEPFQRDGHDATPLHLAAAGGNHEMIQLLVSHAKVTHHANISNIYTGILNAQNAKSETSLIVAAHMGNMKAVESLVRLGTDVDIVDHKGRTALHYAIMNSVAVTDGLITETSANCRDNGDSIPFHFAAILGNEEAAIALKKVSDISRQTEAALNSQNNDGKTPLHLAAEYGHTKLVKLFLENGGKPDIKDREGNRAIDLAAMGGHLDAILALIARSVKDGTPSSGALDVACRAGQLLVVEYLLKYNMGNPDGDECLPTFPLSEAATVGHDSIVRALLRYHANPNVSDSARQTPLHLAAKHGQHVVVQTLLDHGANANARNMERETPLHQATRSGTTEAMSYLIRVGADIQASSREKRTPLHLAVHSPEATQILLINDADPDSVDVLGQTPLHIASSKAYYEALKLLLASGADASIQDDEGATPLDLAARKKDIDLVKILCEYVVKTDNFDDIVYSAACVAVDVASVEVLIFLLTLSPQAMSKKDDEGRTLLHLAADNNTAAVLAGLLQQSSTVDPLDDQDKTPLHYAAIGGCCENIQHLIARGAEVDKKDEKGYTALHYAVESRKPESVALLISANAKLDQVNEDGETPLFVAAYIEETEITKRLLDSGADVHITDKGGWTPLHAAATGSLEVTDLLVSSGTDVNIAGSEGWTPLHIAAKFGNEDITKILLKSKADPDAVDANGCTALHLACEEGMYQIVKVLLEGHASAIVKSQDSKTCLDRAVQRDHHRIVELLIDRSTDITWETDKLVHCYWEAIDHYSIRTVKCLVDVDSSLLSRESTEGLTGLETSVLRDDKNDKARPLALCLLELGADPFRRGTGSSRTAFELGVFSHRELKSSFIQACVEKIATRLELSPSNFGFEELRIAAELDDSILWDILAPLRENEEVLQSKDDDGWNIDCFIHQSNGKVKADVRDFISLKATREPGRLIVPDVWMFSRTNDPPHIEVSGLDVHFPARKGPVALRADFPFRPRGTDVAYFEITIHRETDETKPTGEDPVFTLAIGACGEFSNMTDSLPGWNVWSLGYHSDDGNIYEEDSITPAEAAGKTFSPGSTVGCGIDYSKGEYFFILNGEIIASRRSSVIHRKLYPIVGHDGASCRITVSFRDCLYAWPEAVEQLEVKGEAPSRLQRRSTNTALH